MIIWDMKEQFFNGLDKLLMLNLFLVLGSFFWFAIALIGHLFDIPLGLDLWYKLWEPLFTPAIGLLMGAAILSGVSRWVSDRLGWDQD